MSHLHTAAVALSFAAITASAATPTTNPAEPEQAAFAQLRDPDDLLAKQDFELDTAPLDATVAAYVEHRRPVIDLLLQAATLPNADWGEPADVQRQLDDLKDARTAVRLTWLAARFDAANGRHAQAVNELLAGIAVARHIGQRNLMICHMVECGCEYGSIDRLARLLPTLPRDVVETLSGRLDGLPPSSGLAKTIDGERGFGLKLFEQQLNAIPPAAPNNVPPDPTPRGQAEAAAARAEDAKQEAAGKALLTIQVNAAGPFYDAAKKAAAQPPEEFEKSIKAAAAAMPGNWVARTIAPSLQRQRMNSAKVEAVQAMLRTAIAITLRGDGEVAACKDPFGGKPFGYEPLPGGFRLTSGLKDRGKAVTLRVGR